MLDTVLQIGKALRHSEKNLMYHRYIKPCPQDTDKVKILRLSLPIREDYTFDFDSITEIKDENVIKNELYYLTFKTSDADGLVKYIFGDIYYTANKGKEGGYYRLPNLNNKQKAYQVSSFDRGKCDFLTLNEIAFNLNYNVKWESFILKRFRDEFEKYKNEIETILKYQAGIVEYISSENISGKLKLSALLEDGDKLHELAAKNSFNRIKLSRTSRKTFMELLELEEPMWDDIKSSTEYKSKLIQYAAGSIFLHFDFNNKNWYDFEDATEVINHKLLEEFVESSKTGNGYILKKYLYKTLSSPEKDYQFPYFNPSGRYKNRLFYHRNEILDLFYAIDYSKTPLIKIPKSEIKIIVLPKGVNLTSNNYEDFIHRSKSSDKIEEKEKVISEQNIPIKNDLLFEPLVENVAENIIQYDLILSKQGGQTSPDIDMIEISGIEKSKLVMVNRQIRKIKNYFQDKMYKEFKKQLDPLSVVYSFLKILGDSTKAKKKYQNHLLKVLPQIYSGTYYRDSILLPVFIEQVEYNIRNDKSNYNFLKYDFYFLTAIQNTKTEGENIMKIKESNSYRIGILLGKLARSLKFEIKSFEKNYVGNLSRRISTITDVIKFKTFIEEKLVIHEKNFENVRATSLELASIIKEFSGRYDKNDCAFGFFESYFAPIESKKQTENKTENLL